MKAQVATPTAEAKKAQPTAVALFVSDLHLSPALPATTQAFFTLLQGPVRQAQQLYLLGDIFEYWVGDDDMEDEYNRRVISALKGTADAGVEIFWIAGNRDFLVGARFAQTAKLTLLPDPFVTHLAGQRIVLTHGDAHCIDDAEYMRFRAQVRQPQWQQTFLSQPLSQRKKIVEAMRMGSKEAQRGKSTEIMDVNPQAIASLFISSEATVMVHGHTHRPALHQTSIDSRVHRRYVLPDWECEEEPSRGGWLTLAEDGMFHRYDAKGNRVA